MSHVPDCSGLPITGLHFLVVVLEDGWNIVLLVFILILDVAVQETCFTNGSITDDDNFLGLVVLI